MFRWESQSDALINIRARLLSLANCLNKKYQLRREGFTEALASEYNGALPLECGRTSAEPNAKKTLA
jgi:hypothetical protein